MGALLTSQIPNCKEIHYDKNEYEAGDQAYYLRLRALLFEHVKVETLDHGHKIHYCFEPRDL